MVSANLICLGLRFPSVLSASTRARISRLLSGVRSSCDMLARNSLLYLEVSASCSAFSSSACLACSISRFLASTSVFCSASSLRFFLQLRVGLLQLFGQRLALLQQLLGTHRRRDGVQHDADTFRELIEERDVNLGELLEGGQLHHGLHFAFEQHRQNDDGHRRAGAQAGADPDVILRNVAHQNALLLSRALAHQTLAQPELHGRVIPVVEGVSGHELQAAVPSSPVSAM